MKLKKILVGIEYSGDEKAINELDVTGVCGDSRKILPGEVFVCIKGGEKNGMDYISEAEREAPKPSSAKETSAPSFQERYV